MRYDSVNSLRHRYPVRSACLVFHICQSLIGSICQKSADETIRRSPPNMASEFDDLPHSARANLMNSHNNLLDIYKFIYAIILIILHSSEALGRKLLPSGAIAADWFFIVSGIFIASSAYRNQSVWFFIYKLVKKVYPYVIITTCEIVILWLIFYDIDSFKLINLIGSSTLAVEFTPPRVG